jgi:hypothetical protein
MLPFPRVGDGVDPSPHTPFCRHEGNVGNLLVLLVCIFKGRMILRYALEYGEIAPTFRSFGTSAHASRGKRPNIWVDETILDAGIAQGGGTHTAGSRTNYAYTRPAPAD